MPLSSQLEELDEVVFRIASSLPHPAGLTDVILPRNPFQNHSLRFRRQIFYLNLVG